MRWIETGTPAKFRIARLPDGTHNLVISGLTQDSKYWQPAIDFMGFRVSTTGRALYRKGGKFLIQEAARVFPALRITDLPESVVFLSIQKDAKKHDIPSVEDRRARADMQASIPLGVNYLGQDVYESADGGRFIKGKNGDAISEEVNRIPAAFLRADNPKDIHLCADGFVRRMENEVLRTADLRRFCAVIHGEKGESAPTDSRLRSVQEAIESAIFRNFSEKFKTADEQSFRAAERLLDHQPIFAFRSSESIQHQQHSTPITISVASQYILGDVLGKKVLEPTIGNASLVSLLSGADITGVEIFPERAKQSLEIFKDGVKPRIITGDFIEIADDLPSDFDIIIANPPFGGLAKATRINGLNATRLDQLIVMKALEKRKPDGLSVFIVAADYDNNKASEAGKILGGSQRFYNWMADHYEINVVEVDGSLYSKQGAGYPVRILAVGKKRPLGDAVRAYESEEFRIKDVPVVRSAEELWGAARTLRAWMDGFRQTIPAPTDQDGVAVTVNDYQTQYQPLSKYGKPSSMIPSNLSSAQAEAFARLREEVGDVDKFVMKELHIDNLDIFSDSPEQVDAVALAIFNAMRGRGLILGDQTGQGKGRVVAAMARYAALNGKAAIFLTEKANLFSDFWRDVMDIQSADVFKPIILNDGEKIIDIAGDGAVLINPSPKQEQRSLIDNLAHPLDMGYNLVLATYSQFNRVSEKSAKSRWLAEGARGSFLILDESHNAAGDSSTSNNIQAAIDNADSCIYSSATYAKRAKNMKVYAKAFPSSVNLHNLAETLEAGGEPLQEVIAAMLCSDGTLIRREHDLSALKFSTVALPNEIYMRNRDLADQMSVVLSGLSYLSGDVERVVGAKQSEIREQLKNLSEEQRKGKRAGLSYVNFGSRLYTVQRQFLLALAAETAAKEAAEVLNNGCKPVIVIEQTMETLLKELMEVSAEGQMLVQTITFRDVLHRLLDRVTSVTETNGYGNVVRTDIFKLGLKTGVSAQKTHEAIQSIRDRINSFPLVSAMPLDIIKQGIESAGYVSGEVSGRTFEVRVDGEGGSVVSQMKINRADEVFKFNNGDADAILLSRAGSTGLSIHSSEKFSDRRQRVMIETQIANNVSERIQFFGRVNRRGQVSAPEIRSITSGLPAENRILAMQNAKLRKLSANTQSNRNNVAEIKDVPDILNAVGNEVCKEFLMENVGIAHQLSISLDESEINSSGRSETDSYFANKLTGRIALLPVAEQEAVYEKISSAYTAKLAELTAKGINPFEAHCLDVKAKIVESFTMKGGVTHKSVFDAPVIAQKIEWVKFVEPKRLADVMDYTRSSAQKLIETDNRFLPGGANVKIVYGEMDLRLPRINTSKILKAALAGYDDLMLKSIPNKFANAQPPAAAILDALADKDENIIKRINERKMWLKANVDALMPGRCIQWSTADGIRSGIVARVSPPQQGEEHYLGKWQIRIAVPGEARFEDLTFNQMSGDSDFNWIPEGTARDVKDAFDAAPSGEITFSRWVLTGNLFAAAEMSSRCGLGRAGAFTTDDGMRHRAIIAFANIGSAELKNTPEMVSSPESAAEIVIERIASDRSGVLSFGKGAFIRWCDDGVSITCAGTKSEGGAIFANADLVAKIGQFHGTKKAMTCKLKRDRSNDNIKFLVKNLYESGFSMADKARLQKTSQADREPEPSYIVSANFSS